MENSKENPEKLDEVKVTPASNLLHIELVTVNKHDFAQKVLSISNKLNILPDWLMHVMFKETGGTFRPDIKNFAGSGAIGLIQFMPDTAKALGTTIEALSNMSNVEQLDWVYKYLKPYISRMKTFGDVYLTVFYPAAVGKSDDYLLPEFVTKQNKGLDLNKDGRISKKEIVDWVSKGM